ncbi:MAG: restriction endonuclease subunit S [Acidobacteriota bacterium]
MEVRPGYKQTEVGVIPEDWACTTICRLASPVRNAIVGGPFGSDLVSKDYVDDGVPVVRGQNMAGRLVSGEFAFVTHAKATSLQANLAHPGDLVFTQRGTLGQVSLVPQQPYARYLISQSQMKLTVNPRLADPFFFYYVFTSAEQQESIRKGTIQTGVPHINLGILRALHVQRPSLIEQKAIAEALSDADVFIESLEQLLGKKRQIKEGAMQELLIGKKRLPGFRGEWEMKLLGKIAQLRNERINPRRSERHEFCIELEHIEQGTGHIAGSTEISESSSLKSVFRKNDVLFGKLRAYLRKYWLADRDGLCSTEIWVLTAKPTLLIPEFLFQLIQLDRFIQSASSSYGTHMPRSDWSVVKNYELRLPSVAEQVAVAAILSDMDTEIDALHAKVAKARAIKQGMRQEVLTGRIRLVNATETMV